MRKQRWAPFVAKFKPAQVNEFGVATPGLSQNRRSPTAAQRFRASEGCHKFFDFLSRQIGHAMQSDLCRAHPWINGLGMDALGREQQRMAAGRTFADDGAQSRPKALFHAVRDWNVVENNDLARGQASNLNQQSFQHGRQRGAVERRQIQPKIGAVQRPGHEIGEGSFAATFGPHDQNSVLTTQRLRDGFDERQPWQG